MKIKIFERHRKLSPNPKKSYRLHRVEFGHNVKEKKIPEYSYYPDTLKITKFISKFNKVSEKNISIGLGAEAIIKDIFIFLNKIKKKKIFFLEPTFGMYRYYSKIFDFNIYSTKLYPGEKFYVDELKKTAIKFKIDVIVLVNPSHPIENFYDKKSLLKILHFCKIKKIFLIIDEVYNFDKNVYKKFLSYKNVVFLRSFSKVYGLPGLRLGYAIANKDTIKYIENYRLAIEVGSNTVNFFNNTKTVKSIILKNQKKIKKAIKYARNNFQKRNVYCYNQRVNSVTFDCLNFKRRERIHKYLQNFNIFTLKLKGEKLNRFINITSTNIDNLKFFFEKLDKFNSKI